MQKLYQQNLSTMETTKKLGLEALDCHNFALKELLQKISKLEEVYAGMQAEQQEENNHCDKMQIDPTTEKIAKERLLLLLKNVDEEKEHIKGRKARLEELYSVVDKSAMCSEMVEQSQLKFNMLQDKIITKLEVLCQVKCTIVDDQTVTVAFIDPESERLPEDSKLVITLFFTLENNGCLELSEVNTNIKMDEMAKTIQTVKNDKDIPKLIRNIKKLWLSHWPLLAEISALREHHAIDWRAEERALHLIPTKYIVCRLSIPPTYPHEGGSIVLEQVMGGPKDLTEESISPPNDPSLTGWVTYLEGILS